MRSGFYSKLLFTQSGNLLAFGTGSDACAEHECGSKPMMDALCNQVQSDAQTIHELQRRAAGKTTIREKIFGMKDMTYPDFLENKRVVKFPENLRFIRVDGDVPEAYIALSNHDVTKDAELSFREFFGSSGDRDVAGAWDDRTFAIRVRGKKYVKALAAFYQDMLAGKVVFAGSFLKKGDLGGVIMANTRYFGEEIKATIAEAQQSHESGLRLKSVDDTRALYAEMRQASGVDNIPGYLWVRWLDKEESGLAYCLNPGYAVKADYLGPYTRQQLLDWAATKYQTHLKRA